MKTLLAVLLLVSTPALAQNVYGLKPEGTLIPGNCLQVGTTSTRVADSGAPCGTGTAPPPHSLTIGDPVVGATSMKCLTVDAAGKLAQANCLLAQ